MIYANVITEEKKTDGQEWKSILNLTVHPKRLFICEQDPILMVDALIEQLPHEKLKILVDELVYRTKLLF